MTKPMLEEQIEEMTEERKLLRESVKWLHMTNSFEAHALADRITALLATKPEPVGVRVEQGTPGNMDGRTPFLWWQTIKPGTLLYTAPQEPVDKKDAERYRWLRNSHNQGANSPEGEGLVVVTDRPAEVPRYIGPLCWNLLDEAIDAAIQEQKK